MMTDLPHVGIQSLDPPALPADGIDDLLFGLDADDLNDFDGLDDFGDGLNPSASHQPTTSFGGFTTGRMKTLPPPSATSISRVRKLFEEEEDELSSQAEPPSATSPGPSKRAKLDDQLLIPTSSQPIAPIQSTSMFKTASDKVIPPPSSSTLNKIAAIFDEFTGPDAETEAAQLSPPSVPTFTSPFRTGSGAQAPHISAAAQTKIMRLFKDGPITASSSMGTSLPSFTTASGKSTPAVSASSLARARAIFSENDDDTTSPGVTPSGLVPTLVGSTAPMPKGSALTSPMMRTANLSSEGAAPSLGNPKPSQETRPVASTSFATPSRTPLRTTTNTFANRMEATPISAKSVQPIQIRTPSGPVRRVGMGGTPSMAGRSRRPFATPFKAPSSVVPQTTSTSASSTRATIMDPQTPASSTVTQLYPSVFDCDPGPSRRKTMREAFLKPQYYSHDELAEMDIPSAVWEMGIPGAMSYQFVEPDGFIISHSRALSTLKRDGCHLATQKWVQNHWAQIVWKLAGQVQAQPELFAEKWTSTEVLNQLRYRYEREFNRAQRPIIRRIHEHDSPAGLPMNLLVTAIHYQDADRDERDDKSTPRPCVKLSDGWYHIRAELDECLVRAVRRGRIKVGRKLAVIGAKLDSTGEGSEALDGLDKSRLILSGNGTSLARWDATLGLQSVPFVAGLSSLSVDGGLVPLMEVVIEKLFPLAFMHADKGSREAPWNEEDEARRAHEWTNRREREATRLQDEMRKRIESYEDLAASLASAAEEVEGPYDDSPPDNVDSTIDDLLRSHNPSSALRSMPSGHIPHLAREAQLRLNQETQEAQVEMAAQLEDLVPARRVRDFRMARVVDAREGRKERARVGMVNVWEARALDGLLQEGRRYLITNIMPGRNGDWSVPRPGRAEIYLHTRRDTRWRLIE